MGRSHEGRGHVGRGRGRGFLSSGSLACPSPADTGELKSSQPGVLWQLPLAPVFQPTERMRHGEWGLLPTGLSAFLFGSSKWNWLQ